MVEMHQNGVFLEFPRSKFLQEVYGLLQMDITLRSLCLVACSMP